MKLASVALAFAVAAATSLAGQNAQRPRLDQVPPILRLSIRSMPNLTFSGTRTVEQFQGAGRESHVEYVLRRGGKTRVWFPNDSPYAGQVIVENLRQRRHYFPGRNEIKVSPPKREEAIGRLLAGVAGQTVRFTTEPGGTIAGRTATQVSVMESGNLRQRLWIDVANGMILRRDVFDDVGARIGSYEFSEVDYNPTIRDGDFELERRGAKVVTLEDEARGIARRLSLLHVAFPPAEGLQLDAVRLIRGNAIPVLHLSFSRERTVVSVFQAKGRVELPMMKRANRNVKVYTWNSGGNTFLILGNVEVPELKRLAGLLSAS